MLKRNSRVLAATLLFLVFASVTRAGDTLTPGELVVEPPTLICLGFEWYFQGDDDGDAVCDIQFRRAGEGEWRRGMPLLRVPGEEPKEKGWYQKPMFSGSLIDLEPDTEYEVRLTLTDPGGIEGQSSKTLKVRTRGMPKPDPEGEVRHVYPPKPRHQGQPQYNSIAAALRGRNLGAHDAGKLPTDDAATPGTTILVHGGTYKPNRYWYRDPMGMVLFGSNILSADGTREKPIYIKAAGDGEPIFDFDGNYCGFNVMGADWLVFDGLTIRNTDIAFMAGMWNTTGCVGLTVRNCRIEDVNSGVIGFHGRCREFTIADNEFHGRYEQQETVGEGAPMVSMYGVNLCGGGHVVCHNSFERFFDVIDVWTEGTRDPSFRCWAYDIYNNDIRFSPDNAIEADGGYTNIRILRNRCTNSGGIALSNQRPSPGPVYWIRNVVVNGGGAAFKDVAGISGLRVYHNTIFAHYTMNFGMRHTDHRNNLFMGPPEGSGRRGQEKKFLNVQHRTEDCIFDYNGHCVGPDAEGLFRYRGPQGREMTVGSLAELAQRTPIAHHGLSIPGRDIFVKVSPPAAQEDVRRPLWDPEAQDLRLRPASLPVDRGAVIPNVNEDFTGVAPDPGACEVGAPAWHYGPRSGGREQRR